MQVCLTLEPMLSPASLSWTRQEAQVGVPTSQGAGPEPSLPLGRLDPAHSLLCSLPAARGSPTPVSFLFLFALRLVCLGLTSVIQASVSSVQ